MDGDETCKSKLSPIRQGLHAALLYRFHRDYMQVDSSYTVYMVSCLQFINRRRSLSIDQYCKTTHFKSQKEPPLRGRLQTYLLYHLLLPHCNFVSVGCTDGEINVTLTTRGMCSSQ